MSESTLYTRLLFRHLRQKKIKVNKQELVES